MYRRDAIVAFSFGSRATEPGISNEQIADAVMRDIADRGKPALLVAQLEVASALAQRGVTVDHVVSRSTAGNYLDSENVWAQARGELQLRGIREVRVFAHPFLHFSK